jgi:hypothetical protein
MLTDDMDEASEICRERGMEVEWVLDSPIWGR